MRRLYFKVVLVGPHVGKTAMIYSLLHGGCKCNTTVFNELPRVIDDVLSVDFAHLLNTDTIVTLNIVDTCVMLFCKIVTQQCKWG